jgi:hypothetical protein
MEDVPSSWTLQDTTARKSSAQLREYKGITYSGYQAQLRLHTTPVTLTLFWCVLMNSASVRSSCDCISELEIFRALFLADVEQRATFSLV